MLTRCPNCATTFRVQPEQLKVRHGKVRCGSCQQVFNALDTLVEEAVSLLPVALPPSATGDSSVRNADSTLPDALQAEVAQVAVDINVPTPASESIPDESISATAEEPAPPIPLAFHTDSSPGLAGNAAVPPAVPEFRAMPLGPVEQLDSASTWSDSAGMLSSELHEAKGHFSPWRAMLLAALIGLALSALLLQAAYVWRTELALAIPETRPLLEAACQRLGCALELPQRPDLLSIESSDLNPDPADNRRLRLGATLRNRASHVQAWPHLELSLTDAEDRAIVRKVLAPADYLPYLRSANLRSGLAANTDIPLEMQLDPGVIAASGYRLYLFYP